MYDNVEFYFPPSGAEVVTSLPLQMAIYFNALYAPLWAVGSILALHTKVHVPINFTLISNGLKHVSIKWPETAIHTYFSLGIHVYIVRSDQ